MKENSSSNKANPDSNRSVTRANGLSKPILPERRASPVLPLVNQDSTASRAHSNNDESITMPFPSADGPCDSRTTKGTSDDASKAANPVSSPDTSTEDKEQRAIVANEKTKEKHVLYRFYYTGKDIILSSYINLLLVFVPVGIAAKAASLNPSLIFAMNAIAIVPLAGLLSHATESVAKRMGDTIGALMNVTFGNAVELIILYMHFLLDSLELFADMSTACMYTLEEIRMKTGEKPSIALVKNEIRIVQASLLGSILANLLLILGMCFLVGGLRYREQIYNSTVTQMSACLLSLSVMSLLLPTAFHASFTNTTDADNKVLKVSRGTSVILLIVYAMYLLFQLKSHAYMYQSTPQNLIDEELAPGPVAAWLDSSSSGSNTSSDSDSESSSGSNTTAKRIKRVMRGGRRRRKSSSASKDTAELTVRTRGSSCVNGSAQSPFSPSSVTGGADSPPKSGAIDVGDEADHEVDQAKLFRRERKKERKQHKKRRHRKNKHREKTPDLNLEHPAQEIPTGKQPEGNNEPRCVDFAMPGEPEGQQFDSSAKRPFTLRGLRPAIPKSLSQNIFTQSTAGSSSLNALQIPMPPPGPIPRVRYGIRRTNSLPDRLNQTYSNPAGLPAHVVTPRFPVAGAVPQLEEEDDENISRTTAVMLLLISTALVAVCAEFMVDSINAVVNTPGAAVSEAFIGLIVLPIVGNAAEHVTAVTVASKNKMDLAIGVAVGSSIQIALFVTPFVVLLGWVMHKDMSLYFTLFETVSLFVSAFIVNFLVLDGRSNYLEGALLCAAYVIIAVAAFFYPAAANASVLGGTSGNGS